MKYFSKSRAAAWYITCVFSLKFLSTMSLCIWSLYVSIAQSPSAESKIQRHIAGGDAKEDCRTIGIERQGVEAQSFGREIREKITEKIQWRVKCTAAQRLSSTSDYTNGTIAREIRFINKLENRKT